MDRVSTISKRLKDYRSETNKTLADLSRITGIPAQTLNRYELGQRIPKIDAAVKIAEAIGVNPLWLQGYDVEKEVPPAQGETPEEEFIRLFKLLPDDLKAGILAQIKAVLVQRGLLPSL